MHFLAEHGRHVPAAARAHVVAAILDGEWGVPAVVWDDADLTVVHRPAWHLFTD